MKNFVLSVAASLVASVVFFLFTLLSSVKSVVILFSVLCGITLIFLIYLIIVNKQSKNPLMRLKLAGRRVRIIGRDDQVVFLGVSLLRPNYIKFKNDDGSIGHTHYSNVVIFV